jgi:serine/threonine protein kinase
MTFNPLLPGTILSRRYKISVLLKRGGMGAAYQAIDLESGKIVAVKELVSVYETLEDKETGIGNFLAEMGVLKSLFHPQIPKILDHFVENRGFFFVMEFIEGKDFSSFLNETGRIGLSEEKVARIGIEVCRILDYLHTRKPAPVIHKDIKSSNLMERKVDGKIFLIDFGIANAGTMKQGMMIGTAGYAPPEQYLNQVDSRSDLYALGATLHEISTGKRPDESSFDFLPPCDLNSSLSKEFSEILLTALSYEPENRFQSAELFEEALQTLLPEKVPENPEHSFQESCRLFFTSSLFPLLQEVQKDYMNECQTLSLPENQGSFSFVLGVQVPYVLMVESDPVKTVIRFSFKEGLLSKTFMGEISPGNREDWEKGKRYVEQFVSKFIGNK